MIRYIRATLVLTIAISGGIINSMTYINPYEGSIFLSSLVLQLSGSRGDLVLETGISELLGFSMRMLPMFIVSVVIGIQLYSHFCTASVYVFSRYPDRFRWYMSEAFIMLFTSLIFEVLCLLSSVVVTEVRYEVIIDKEGFIISAYHILIFSLWLYCSALLMGIIATYTGSDTAYISIIGVQLFMIAMLSLTNTDFGLENVRYNPASRLVLGWYSSEINSISAIVGDHVTGRDYGISFKSTFIIFIVIVLAITYIVERNIERRDLYYFEAET